MSRHRTNTALTTLALVLASSGLSAQEYLREVRLTDHIPTISAAQSFATGDLDGDGDIDVVVGCYGQDRVLRNDGHARLTDVTALSIPQSTEYTQVVVLLDVELDGDLDLIRLFDRGQPQLLVNDSTGFFTDRTGNLPTQSVGGISLVATDLDRDGDTDLVVRGSTTPLGILLWFNDGSGRFTDLTASKVPAHTADLGYVVAADVDGDGNVDLVRASTTSVAPLDLWLNDGTGGFRVAGANWMPASTHMITDLIFSDIDRDGDSDLIVIDGGRGLSIFVNDRQNRFVDTPNLVTLPAGTMLSIAAADFDGDLDIDFAIGMSSRNHLMVNNGGTWTHAPGSPFGTTIDQSYSVTTADLDGNGLPEVFFGARWTGQVELWLNGGARGFYNGAESRLGAGKATSFAVTLGDVTGDGNLDLAIDNSILGIQIYRNNSRGKFDVIPNALDVPFRSRAADLELFDVDADGDLDLMIASTTGQNELYRQDASRRFVRVTTTAMPPDINESTDIALGDLDGDGDADAFVANASGQANRLLRNDGFGNFVDSPLTPDNDTSIAVALGDIDGDGDLDAVVGNNKLNKIYINDGSGTFTIRPLSTVVSKTNAVVLFDFDTDGDLDIATANMPAAGHSGQNRLFQNDGTGQFTEVTSQSMPTIEDWSTDMVATDFDRDGDTDLVVGNVFYLPDGLLINDGFGRFRNAKGVPRVLDLTTAIAVGDVDRDGDSDVISANAGDMYPRLFINLTTHVEAPVHGRAGHPFIIGYSRNPFLGTAAPYAGSAISFGLLSPPIPVLTFGFFYLDPTSMLGLPILPLDSLGIGEVSYPMPNHTTVIGLTFYIQTLFAGSLTGPFQLSNVVECKVVF